MTNMTMKTCLLTALLFLCGAMAGVQAQVMKAADLEKYAKEKYGDKWLDAAANLAKDIKFDKNQSLTYQQVIEAPGKTKQQRLYHHLVDHRCHCRPYRYAVPLYRQHHPHHQD